MPCFLSRRYRPNKWPFYILLGIEGPLTVALLALFGIADPNLYRTRLWLDGALNGFNSNPNQGLYAAANYQPYTTPKVWSQFITSYNVVISVLSMFIMLCKSVMYILEVFPPIFSAIVHAILVALYAVSVSYQVSPDLSDPSHPQHGPPWYITKSCSVSHNPANVGYCRQAKASFACTVVGLVLFGLYFLTAVYSCFPSRAHQMEYSERRRSKAARYSQMEEDGDKYQASSMPFTPGFPRTPGTTGGIKSPMNPMTPRTLAFNRLGGTKNDLPLRSHFSSPNAPKSPTFALRSPDIPRSPLSPGFARAEANATQEVSNTGMYFPPPPKQATK